MDVGLREQVYGGNAAALWQGKGRTQVGDGRYFIYRPPLGTLETVRSDMCGSDSAESLEPDLVVVVLGGLMARWVAQARRVPARCSVWSSSPPPW
jgi:hypothetical protein